MDSPQPRFVVSTTSGSADPDEDLEAPLYLPFKTWLDAKPGRYVLVTAAALIAVQAVVRGYIKLGGMTDSMKPWPEIRRIAATFADTKPGKEAA